MSSKPTGSSLPGLDRESYEPAYAQVVRILSQEIAQGLYRPGDQLPSESQLCARFGVSGMTVRRAINILVDRGIVSASQGKGTFVRGLDVREAAFRLRERHDESVLGPGTEVRLLQASILAADERMARKLGVGPGTRVIYLRRIVFESDEPVMYHREYMVYNPRRPTVEAELQITSLEGLFRGQDGQGLRRGDLSVEAAALNEEEAGALQVPVGSPALYLEHIFYDFENRPVAWGWFICRADRFKLVGGIGPETSKGAEH
jgi:DNA-binding GntR family transcriptional regulator